MEYPFKNLVFEGGGVKGVAYGGALNVLDKRGILSGIERVGGTSAGAITATLLALDYSAEYIKELMLHLDFTRFKDGSLFGDIERFFTKYGWYKGEVFLEFIQNQIADKLHHKDATFHDLIEHGFRDLYVVGTDLSAQTDRVFSHETTPDLPIADAVRISMSIPLFFASRKLGGSVYVDGGVVRNYPLGLFDSTKTDPANPGRQVREANQKTLGFHLGKNIIETHDISDLDEYAGNLFETILAVQDIALMDNADDVARTVFINVLGIKSTDFGITTEQKLDLIKKGHEATANYLRARFPGGAGE